MSQVLVNRDPRTDIRSESDIAQVVDVGGQRLSISRNPSVNYSATQDRISYATWTINPPSNQTIIGREFRITYYIVVKTDIPIIEGVYDCLRQFPVSSLIDNINFKVNGSAQVSKRCGDLLHAEMSFSNECEDRRKAFMTPSYPDQFGQLADGYGLNRNPAVLFGENVNEPSRYVEYVEANEDLTEIRYKVTEPVFISPLLDGVGSPDEGLVNVNEIFLQLFFKTRQDRILTCMNRDGQGLNNIANVTVGFYEAPELVLTYITPNMMDMIPAVQVLPYVEPDFHRKIQNMEFVRNVETRVESETYRIGQVPKMLMIYLPRTETEATFDKPDSFLEILSCKIQWNNENSLLTMANQEELYQMSRRNGCNMSFHQWRTRGSVLMLHFGTDLGLPDGLSPSTVGSFNLKVELQVRNSHMEDNVRCDLCTVLYNQGSFVIAQNTGRVSLGSLTPSMVLSAEKAEQLEHHEHPAKVQGHGLLSSIRGMIPKKKHHRASPMEQPKAPEPRKIGGSLRR
jgi:hypothetical protein